jgi:hypothetical protein
VQLSLESMDVAMLKPHPSEMTADTARCTCAYLEIPKVTGCSSQGHLWRDRRADEGLIGSVQLRCFRPYLGSSFQGIGMIACSSLKTHPTLPSTLQPKHSAELWLFRGCTIALAGLSWRQERHRTAAGRLRVRARVALEQAQPWIAAGKWEQ